MNVVNRLLNEIEENIDDGKKRREVERLMTTIDSKMKAISALNETILDEIEEEKMEDDMDIATKFEVRTMQEMDKFKEMLEVNIKI